MVEMTRHSYERLSQRGSVSRIGFRDAIDNYMRQRMDGRNTNFAVPEQTWGVFSSSGR